MAEKVYILWVDDYDPEIIAIFNKKPSDEALSKVFGESDLQKISKLTVDDAVRQIQKTGAVFLAPEAMRPYYTLEARGVEEV